MNAEPIDEVTPGACDPRQEVVDWIARRQNPALPDPVVELRRARETRLRHLLQNPWSD